MKIAYLVKARQDLSHEAFVQHWTTTHAGLAESMPGLRGYEINLPSLAQKSARPYDGFAVLRFDSYADAKAAWDSAPGKATAADGELFMAGATPFIAEPRVVLEPPSREGLCAVVYFPEKLSGTSDEELESRWTGELAELVLALPGLLGLEVNLPSGSQRGPRPVDGMGVLWFESYGALVEAWRSPQGADVVREHGRHMAAAPHVLVDTRIVI